MKLFLCTWYTKSGLNCCVISAINQENAVDLCIDEKTGYDVDIEVNEIVPSDKEEVLDIMFL